MAKILCSEDGEEDRETREEDVIARKLGGQIHCHALHSACGGWYTIRVVCGSDCASESICHHTPI